MSEEQNIQPLNNEEVKEPKQRKVYQKKGIDSRGRAPDPNKTTPYGMPTDPDYYKKYYREKLSVKVQCPECLMSVCKINIKKHKTSAYHQRFCKVIEQTKPIDV